MIELYDLLRHEALSTLSFDLSYLDLDEFPGRVTMGTEHQRAPEDARYQLETLIRREPCFYSRRLAACWLLRGEEVFERTTLELLREHRVYHENPDHAIAYLSVEARFFAWHKHAVKTKYEFGSTLYDNKFREEDFYKTVAGWLATWEDLAAQMEAELDEALATEKKKTTGNSRLDNAANDRGPKAKKKGT